MRYTFIILILMFPLLVASACESVENSESDAVGKNDTMSDSIKIAVAGKTFTAILTDNETAKAFKTMLPMTVVMTELNGNEKLYRLPNTLPVNASNPGTINTGDLMLYGSNTLVLFYKTFPTSYSYTRIGRIENPSGLASTLGSGNATVIFELQ